MANCANITRRTAIKGGVAVALTAHTTVASGDDNASALTKLIDRHKTALSADKKAWNVVADITEALEHNGHEMPKVTIGVYHTMDGGKPIIGRTESDVRSHYAKHLKAQLSLLHPSRVADRADVTARYEKDCEAKVSELTRLQVEYRRREDEAGYTDAMGKAREVMATVRGLEKEIVAYVPASFQETVQKAAWCAWAMKDDYCYLNDADHPEDVLVEALAAIGKATV
ncbi:hypothetical protein [Agrobacterium pusense]|uniref:hypothetical protein n=1 Tax=Agrobacterium pusense TaxID=648995 RepID=UPI0010AE0682|nr:hypothetical protein [Agrobacterium pusense]WCK26662.1 hypothetical protein CFBP5496_0020900 [Agrobacterium pusense]